MIDLPDSAELFVDGAHGIYVPQMFVRSVIDGAIPESFADDAATLEAGPDDEWYWEAWANMLDNMVIVSPVTGDRFTLYQDSDLWIIPEDAVWPDDDDDDDDDDE